MKRWILYTCFFLFCSGLFLAIPKEKIYADDFSFFPLLQSIFNFLDIPTTKIVSPQVGGVGSWNFPLDFGSDNNLKPVINGAVIGESNSHKSIYATLNNTQQGLELRNGCLSLLSDSLQQNTVKWPSGPLNDGKPPFYQITANHTLTFYDEEGPDCHHPDSGKITIASDYGWENVLPASDICYAALSVGSLKPDEMNFPIKYPNEHVTKYNGLCDQQDPGKHVGTFKDGDGSQEIYTGVDLTSFPILHYFTQAEIDEARRCHPTTIIDSKGHHHTTGCPPLIAHPDATITLSTNHPWADLVSKWTGMDPLTGEKNGFTYSLIPSIFNLSDENGTFDQPLDLNLSDIPTFNNNPIDIPKAVYAYEYGRRQHIDAFNCALTPQQQIASSGNSDECQFPTYNGSATMIGTIPPNVTVTSNNAQPSNPANLCQTPPQDFTPNLSGNVSAIVQSTSAKYGIPTCVLDGVAHHEGAYDNTYLIGGVCAPDACGATGPFQLTVGYTYTSSGDSCQQDTTCSTCSGAGGSCPNALKDYVPGTNPCDLSSAADGAAQMLIGKAHYYGYKLDTSASAQAIVAAGDSYFGSTMPHYSGNCSYGEDIYKTFCNHPDYVCTPHALPSPSPLQQ